jgi:hypothetical protein
MSHDVRPDRSATRLVLDAPREPTDLGQVAARPSGLGSTIDSIPIAGGVTLLAVGLMAWDHLWGNEPGSNDGFPVDPAAFFLALALIVVTALVVFGATVPRAVRRPESVHRAALIHSGIALVLAVPGSWLGFPMIVAGGGIALGIHAGAGDHRRLALGAVVLGLLVIVLGILGTAFPASETD